MAFGSGYLIAMAGVPTIVPFNEIPDSDVIKLNSGYPSAQLLEKSAQAFDKAASECMVRATDIGVESICVLLWYNAA